MATQTIEFDYVAGQTLTAKLFPIDSDTQSGTTQNAVEADNRDGLYSVAFSDRAAGQYVLRVYAGASFVAAFEYILAVVTATYRPADDTETKAMGADVVAAIAAAVKAQFATAPAAASSGSVLQNLQSAQLRLSRIYNDLLASPKPNYTVGGDTYQWSDYLAKIGAELDSVTKRIVAMEGPFEVVSRAE